MDRVPTSPPPRRLSGKRRQLLREYFLNALTLALMKEAGSLGTPMPPRPSRPDAPSGTRRRDTPSANRRDTPSANRRDTPSKHRA